MASEESMKELSASLAGAIRQAVLDATQAAVATSVSPTAALTRGPTFSMPEYKAEQNSSVNDYFERFQWALAVR